MSVSWPLGFAGAMHYSISGADNARFIARIYGKPLGATLEFVEDFAELGEYFGMPVRTYSSGMMMRLGFALSLAVDFDCYLVDEVVAVGDTRFGERCRQALAERRERERAAAGVAPGRRRCGPSAPPPRSSMRAG